MTKTKLFVCALLLLAIPAWGQTILTNTTLSAAVSKAGIGTVVVTSATGINAPSASDYTKQTFLYVDRELMDVRAVSGTTITVVRGAGGTAAATHASGAYVFVIPAYLSSSFSIVPNGSCTRGNELALPRIDPRSGTFSDCLGGQWVSSTAGSTFAQPAIGLRFPDPGSTAYASLQTNGTALNAATEIECTEIDLPNSMMMTGLGILNGTAHTNNVWVLLYDSGGNLLANSATAGVASATDSVYQKVAFTSPYYAVGPMRYFGCWGANGTTVTVRHPATGSNDSQYAGAVTGQTFGTAAATITVPASFTTVKGPYLLVY